MFKKYYILKIDSNWKEKKKKLCRDLTQILVIISIY